MRRKPILILIGVIAAMLVGGFWLKKPVEKQPAFMDRLGTIASTSIRLPADVKQSKPDARYINPNYAFSFIPLAGLSATSFNDVDTKGTAVTTVLLQAKDPSEKGGSNKGLQILISTWDESPETLTASRIHKDIPQMKIADVTTRDITNIGTVIEFESDNASFGGKSHEVWFVAHNDLYQISTYENNKEIMANMLSTWNFQ